jgi:hypothetical protein
MSTVKQKIDTHFALCDIESGRSLERFLDHCFIDIKPEPKRYGSVMEPWQRERNQSVTPALEYAAGVRPTYSGLRNFWFECARGMDKTASVARYLNWILCYARRPLRMVACAADKDQAALLQDSMEIQAGIRENQWYGKKLQFQRSGASGPGGQLEILASDAATNQGRTPDVILADEITVWSKPDLWNALFSTGIKRPDSAVTIVITNAGTKGTWVWDLRETVRQSPSEWHFFAQEPYTYPASWMTPERIAAIEKFMSDTEARRLLHSCWLDPGEECGFLTLDEILNCVGNPDQPPFGATVILTADYGTGGDNDRTALAAIWYDGKRVHVTELECWSGPPGSEVQIPAVEGWVDSRLTKYPNHIIVADRHQLLGSLQRWEAAGVRVQRIEFKAGKYNFAIAQNLRDLVRNRRIVFAADAGRLGAETLVSEMSELLMRKQVYGERFDHQKNKHDDRVFVVAAGAKAAIENFTELPTPQADPPPRPLWTPSPLDRIQSLNWVRNGLFGMSA